MKNTVQLLGYYGSDEIIACSAWTSTSRELTEEKRERIPALIKQLWSAGHETPFEKGIVHFLVDTEIASHIHLLKHRMSSFNGESARYKELKEDKYYIPNDWQIVDSVNPIGAYFGNKNLQISVDLQKDSNWAAILKEYTELGNLLYHQCLEDLTPILGRSRAKESARFFKTYNSQIQGDVSFNMRSFANFIKLRDSKTAQKEIREIAQQMWDLVENIPGKPFEETLKVIKEKIISEN